MTITRADAQSALTEIERTEERGRESRAYRGSGYILILWGAIWLIAYTASGILPLNHWFYAWLPADIIGAAGSVYLGRRFGKGDNTRQTVLIGVATLAFISALYTINPPASALHVEVLPPLMVAFLYAVLGAKLIRYYLIGAFLFAATLVGYFAFPAIFAFWMAAIGGGALVLGGLWMRQG